ncbi:MAG TPA: universal stress protein [Streptosporangiaceae bacterium]|jgi:nucleotide-binding universal stress UspA family protein
MGTGEASWKPAEDGTFELGTDGPSVILVGVDDSTTSTRAGWYAAGLARRQRARIVGVFVAPMATFGAAGPGGAGLTVAKEEAFRNIAEDMERRARTMESELGISITVRVARGDPYTEICRIADEVRADAIVVGASAHAGHRFVGSLAVRLVRAGKWPVTVVP